MATEYASCSTRGNLLIQSAQKPPEITPSSVHSCFGEHFLDTGTCGHEYHSAVVLPSCVSWAAEARRCQHLRFRSPFWVDGYRVDLRVGLVGVADF
jgi:hypothetical protein